jgi:PAS domain S-box-containing protein
MTDRASSVPESPRAAALRAYAIVDTPREAAFDELVELAAEICDVPIAVVNLVGDDRQFFKAEIGLGVRETPLETSFCVKALLEDEFLLVPDATDDPRFDGNPLVTGEPHLRFYAGALLRTDAGIAIGTLCVLDYQARTLSTLQQKALRVLASQVMAQLELRRSLASALDTEAYHRAIVDSASDYAIIATDLDGRVTKWSVGAAHILGWSEREMLGQPIDRIFTPEDIASRLPKRAREAALRDGRAIQTRLHLRSDGSRIHCNAEMMPLRGDAGAHIGFVKMVRDRTAEHAAEQGLREAEARLHRAQVAGGIGLFHVGTDGLLHATPEFCRLYGVETCATAPAALFEQLVIADDRGLVSDPASRAAGTAPLDVEYRIRRGDTGELRWIARKGEIERDEAGTPLRFAGVARDITDQVRAREALAAERELLAQMFEQAPTFMALLDGPEHRIARVNPGFKRLIDERDVLGRTVAEALPDAAAQGYVDLLDQVYRTGRAHVAESALYTVQAGPDAPIHERYVDFVYQPIRNAAGEVSSIFVEGADVTERARSAAALRATEERYRTVIDAIDVGFCMIEVQFDDERRPVDYLFLEANTAFAAQTGLADVVGRSMRSIEPGYEQHWFDLYGEVARTGIPARFENGAESLARWWDVHAVRIGDPAANRVAVFFNDISRRKQMEEDLRTAAATLESQVEARTRDLMTAEEQLRQSQKMEAVGQLTGGLAHDFNNLLTGITGSLEMLGIRVGQGRFGDLERYVGTAQGAAKRAAALTHRLLAFSRRQTLDPKPTDANRLIAGMEDMVRRTVTPAVEVEVVAAGGLWPTLVDPNQLENALLNLCINARDAMPDGGRLTIETANRWMDARAARERDLDPGQYISLCVSDTGTGMSPATIAKAFDPFFTTKPIGVGTGLGLSMIYGFARQSGGQVRIYSEVDQGTTVCLYLPRHLGPAEDAEAMPDPGEAPRARAGETVLVVDDEPSVRMLVTEILEELGYAAIEAADGASGLRLLQSNIRIDLLVTDVGLPGGMNGRQMADAARVGRPELQVLFITGYAENAVVGNGQLDPGMHVMTKPFSMDVLAGRIRDLLTHGR